MNNKLPPLSEHDIQANFIREANYEFRNDPTWIPDLFYAVLHGAWIADPQGESDTGTPRKSNHRKMALLNKYKAEGWKSGIPDVHLDQPRGPYNKLVIEFKRADRRKAKHGGLSKEQMVYMTAIAPYAMIRVCYSEEEGMATLREYMLLPDRVSDWRKVLRLENFQRQIRI